MRTKTLVFTAALALAGVASIMAQPVYSVNAVGYVNTALKPGFNLISNPLDAGAGNNTIEKLFANVPDGTVFYKFKAGPGGGFSIVTKDFGDFDPKNVTLVPGEGAFVNLPGTANVTVTFVGEVVQGTGLKVDLASGFNLVSSIVPQAGKIQADLKYTPAESDAVYQWTGTAYKLTTYEFGAWGAGPADEPSIGVGEGFWLQKGAAGAWTRDFNVNQ